MTVQAVKLLVCSLFRMYVYYLLFDDLADKQNQVSTNPKKLKNKKKEKKKRRRWEYKKEWGTTTKNQTVERMHGTSVGNPLLFCPHKFYTQKISTHHHHFSKLPSTIYFIHFYMQKIEFNFFKIHIVK